MSSPAGPRSAKAAPAEKGSRPARGKPTRDGLKIRVEFGEVGFIGPGKIALMELIAKHGSIRSAGKEMGMSYRRAWMLVEETNCIFKAPVVEKQMGGQGGGGARLSQLGEEVVHRFRAIERAAAEAAREEFTGLKHLLAGKARK